MMKVRDLSPEAWTAWLGHPVTRVVMEFLDQYRWGLHQQWEAGAFQAADPAETQAANLNAMAAIKVIKEIRNLTYEDLEEINNAVEENEDVTERERFEGGREGGIVAALRAGIRRQHDSDPGDSEGEDEGGGDSGSSD